MTTPPPSPSAPRRSDSPPPPARPYPNRAAMLMARRRGQQPTAPSPPKMPFDFPTKSQYRKWQLFLCFLDPAHDVGWKLHVVKPRTLSRDNPSLPESYVELLNFLCAEKVPHKIVRSIRALEVMESDPQQKGKFITIYPQDTSQLRNLSDAIDAMMPRGSAKKHSTALGDLPTSSRGIIAARWGGLTSRYSLDANNKLVRDDRSRPYPDWVRNPFDPHSPGKDPWIRFRENPQLMDQLFVREKTDKELDTAQFAERITPRLALKQGAE